MLNRRDILIIWGLEYSLQSNKRWGFIKREKEIFPSQQSASQEKQYNTEIANHFFESQFTMLISNYRISHDSVSRIFLIEKDQ